jgi:hypothetical protein
MALTEQDMLRVIAIAKANPENPEILKKSKEAAIAYRRQQEGAGQPLFPTAEKVRQERGRKIETLFTDRETHGLPADSLEQINENFRENPDEKYALFNRKFFEAQGIDKKKVDALGDDLIASYSRKTWGEEVTDHRVFFDRMGEEFDVSKDLGSRAMKQSMAGVSLMAGLAAIESEKGEDPRFKARKKDWLAAYEKSFTATDAVISPYRELINQTATSLRVKTGLQDGPSSGYEDITRRLLEVAEEDLDLVINAIIETGSDEDEAARKGYGKILAENVGRGLVDLREGVARSTSFNLMVSGNRDQLTSAKRKILRGEIREGTFGYPAEMVEYANATYIDDTPMIQVDPEDPESKIPEAIAIIDKKLHALELTGRIRDIAENGIDPSTHSNVALRGFAMAARSIPYTLSALGGASGFIATAEAMKEQNYKNLRASSPGLSREDASGIAFISSPLQAFTERIQGKLGLGQLKGLNRLFNQVSITRGAVAGRFLQRGVAVAGLEMVQENIQDATPFLIQSIFSALSEDVPSVDWKSKRFEMLKQQPELFFAVLPLALIGAGVGTRSDYKHASEMLSRPLELTLVLGDTAKASEIADIAKSGDLNGAEAMLREAMQSSGKDTEAIQKVRSDAQKSLKAEAELLREAFKRGEDLGIIPVYTPVKDGHKIIFNDGTERVFETYTEANEARMKFAGLENFRFHSDIATTISHVDRTQREGQGARYIFGQRTDTLREAKESGLSSGEYAMERADEAAADGQVTEATVLTDEEIQASIDTEYEAGTTAAEIKALSEEDRLSAFTIIGSNRTFKDGIYITNVRLEAGATWATVIEEKMEGDAFVHMKEGRREWLKKSLRQFERLANEPIFRPGIADDAITDNDIKGAYARAGVAYFIGTADEQGGFQRSAKFKKRYDALVKAGLGGSMEGYARFFLAVALRADALNKLRREGKLDADLERELARSVGFSEQFEYEQKAIEEGQKFKQEIDPDGVLNETAAEFDSAAEAAFENSTDASFSVIHNATGYSGDTGNLGDYNAFLRSRSLLDLNEFRVNPRSNILFRPDRLYRVVNSEGYQDFLDSGLVRPNQVGLRGHTYSHLYAAVGATGARYKGAFVIEMVPEAGQWEFVGAGYARNAAAKIDATGPVRVFRAIEDGSFEVVHDNIGDAAFLEENGQTAGQDETSFSVMVSNKNLSLTNLAKDEREQEPSFSVITNAQDSDLRSTGINVRSDTKNLRYADLLVDGKKLYETRDTNSLKAFIGKTVSIVRTGEGKAKAIGSVKIGEPIEVDESQFRELQDKHLVPPGSTFDIKQGGTKFLYPVTESERYLSELDVSNDGNIFTSRQVIGASPEADSTFSVITNAESRIAESFNPFLRNPEKRLKIVLEAQRRATEKARGFQEIIRLNRSGADIERERLTREADLMGEKLDTLSPSEIGALEAMGTLDDIGMRPILSDLLREKYYKTKSGKSVKYWRGSLMSKSAAERQGIDTKGGEWDGIPEGLPPYVWGGSVMPDQAASQFGFETTDEFWTALSAEVASYQNLKADTKAAMTRIRDLEKEAKAESKAWADEQKRLRKTVGTDRATLIAAMRTLDAMISALPSEIRGKIGGMVRLAQFKGPGAMLDELERRANRLDVELERWLKKEANKGVKKLFERAKPAKDESGKKRVGKAGADIHDLFETARMAWKNWDAEKAEAHAVGIEAEIAKGELSPEWEAHKLLEAELVRSFGGWNQADSVRKNHALETATEIWDRAYLEYREKKAKEKERRDGIRADLRADTGKAGKKSERSLAEMAGVKLPGRVRDFFLSLLNFEQLTKWAFRKGIEVGAMVRGRATQS